MAKGYITLPVGYQRVDNLPLLNDQVFASLAEAQNYLAGTSALGNIAYAGQILAVTEGDTPTVYVVKPDMSLFPIAGGSGGGSSVYVIDLSSLNPGGGTPSEELDTIIGGWDNLVDAVDNNTPIILVAVSGSGKGVFHPTSFLNTSKTHIELSYISMSAEPHVAVGMAYLKIINTSGTLTYSVVQSGLAVESDLPTKVSDLDNDSDFQTATEVTEAINSAIAARGAAYTPKGSKTVAELLELTEVKIGDVYNITDGGTIESGVTVRAGDNVAALKEGNGNQTGMWDVLSGVVDLSGYLTKEEAGTTYAAKADGITSEEREKVSKIKTDGEGNQVLSDAGTYIDLPETGVSSYGQLTDKPTLNGVEINGDQTSEDLKIDVTTTKTTEQITVQLGSGGTAGGYKTGDVIEAGTTLNNFLKKLLQKQVPPTYKAPTLSLSGDGDTPVECGTQQTLKINASFTQNDGGALTSYTLKRGAETLIDGDSSITEYTDENVTIPDGSITYSATASYAQGPIKNDNLGQPYPTGRIEAGTTSQATKQYTGQRFCFWQASPNDLPVASSANIRALTSKGYKANNSNIVVTIPSGTRCVVMAYPETYGELSKVLQQTSNLDIKGSFVKSGPIQVEGANGYTPINYNVYKLYVEPMNADTFTFTI